MKPPLPSDLGAAAARGDVFCQLTNVHGSTYLPAGSGTGLEAEQRQQLGGRHEQPVESFTVGREPSRAAAYAVLLPMPSRVAASSTEQVRR